MVAKSTLKLQIAFNQPRRPIKHLEYSISQCGNLLRYTITRLKRSTCKISKLVFSGVSIFERLFRFKLKRQRETATLKVITNKTIKRNFSLFENLMDFLETSYLNEVIPGGVGRCTPGNSWWGESPDSTNSLPLLDQKLSFSTPFSRPCRFVFRPGGSPRSQNTTYMSTYLGRNSDCQIRRASKGFLKTHFEFAYYSFISSGNSLMRNDIRFQTRSGKSLYPFSDQNGAKTIPFGAVYIYLSMWLI